MIIGVIIAIYFAAITIVSIYYKKEIEHRVVTEINKNLKKPISIQHISISAFSNFPYVSFSLNEVLLPKSDSSKVPLLKLEKLQILFAPYNIFIKNFKVDEILIANGYMDARVDSLGNRDFDIFLKKDSIAKVDPKAITDFKLEKIKFKNINVYYQNQFKPKCVNLIFKNTQTMLNLDSKIVTGSLIGLLYSKEITLKPGTLFREADLQADFHFTFDLEKKIFAFERSTLVYKQNSFLAKGNIDFNNKSLLTLNIKTDSADIQDVFKLIPHRWTDKLQPLNLTGNIDADALIKISLLPNNQPDFTIDFATQNFSVHNEKLNASVHNMGFDGTFVSTESKQIEDYKITFRNLRTVINKDDSLKSGMIVLENFKDPNLQTDVKMKVKSKTIFDIVNFKEYTTATGVVIVDLNYNGKLNYIFGKKTEAPEMDGSIYMNHVNLKLNKVHFAFDDIDGRIHFRNDSIRMHNLRLKSGKTDMTLNGTAYNLFNSVFYDTTGLVMNINFISNNFYFSDFNSASQPSKNPQVKKKIHVVQNNKFILPYDLRASFAGKVTNFYARNYQGNNIELDMKLSNKKVTIVESMNSFGGVLNFTSNFVPLNNEIHCKTNIYMKKFHIDKVFSAFDNFKQKMLNADNIRGTVSGDVYSYFKMSSALVIDSNSLYVNGSYTINKFELIHVEPLLKLTKVGFDEKDLERVTFEQITSSIIIKDHVIEIPRTLYVTNILYFYLDVMIKPDGETNFYVLLPIKNLKKKPDTKGLTNDSKAGLSIPLKITGKAGKLKVL